MPTTPIRRTQTPAVLLTRPMLCATLIAVVVLSLLLPPAAADWVRPVAGPVVRPFTYGHDPFAAGQHRGIDIAARRGAPVRAPCTGRVVFVGDVPNGTRDVRGRRAVARRPAEQAIVTLSCAPWRATLSALNASVRSGQRVSAGTPLGLLRGPVLEFGVRRASDRFGYVDPEHFLSAPRPPARPGPAPPGAIAPPPATIAPPPATTAPPPTTVAPPPATTAPPPRPAPPVRSPALITWPLWLGGTLAAASLTAGTALRRRRSEALRTARASV